MSAWMRNEEREATEARRQRPVVPHRITFAAAGDGALGSDEVTAPTDVFLEVTEPGGDIADWFDDIWWAEVLRRWGDHSLTVHVLPSRQALLHSVVLHHVAMVRRVAPGWRVIGYGYCGEIVAEAELEALATSAYDQVRLVESDRPGLGDGHHPRALGFEDLLARVRRLQVERGATRPILVRAASVPPVPGERPTEGGRQGEAAGSDEGTSRGQPVPVSGRRQ
ncbi:MAG TPA: hypothetical protein VM243_07235 [Phycisphaerae bacterium]|nr:hypothetical protein [Phycisphaerae bacterium]